MDAIKGPVLIGHAVQPVAFSADIDTGLIGVGHIRAGQLFFDPLLEACYGLEAIWRSAPATSPTK